MASRRSPGGDVLRQPGPVAESGPGPDRGGILAARTRAFHAGGRGAARERLLAQAQERKLENVRFLPYQPKSRLGESLAAADVHLIPLQKGLAGYIVPSKLYGILAVGRPYIAMVDADSEVATITREGRTGLRIEPDSAEAFAEVIRWCLTHRAELAQMGRRGQELAEKRFDRSGSVGLFADVLGDLDRESVVAPRSAAQEEVVIRNPMRV